MTSGIVYANGTSTVVNATNPDGKMISDRISGDGVNTGSYMAGSTAFLYFEADVASDSCGEQHINSSGEADNGAKRDMSVVTVNRPC